MDLTLKRLQFRADGIFSDLKAGGDLVAQTLEHAYEGAGWVPKIPYGAFKCVRGTHRLVWHHAEPDPALTDLVGAKFVVVDGTTLVEFDTFEITGVEGHKKLLFHWGNKNADSDGCVLVGRSIARAPDQTQMVTESRESFARFMRLQEGVEVFTLTVL